MDTKSVSTTFEKQKPYSYSQSVSRKASANNVQGQFFYGSISAKKDLQYTKSMSARLDLPHSESMQDDTLFEHKS